jgi:ABC-type multidrug transport system ATPase subunit
MDPGKIRLFQNLALEAVRSGGTVIFSTQRPDLKEDFATRICLINKGKLYADATPRELVKLSETDHLISKLIGVG